MKLTAKQKRFCEEYIVDCNATQAAIRAGYSKKTAYSMGQRLLKNVEVQSYIDELMQGLQDEAVASADEVIQYLTSVMRGKETEQTLKWIGDGVQTIADIDVSAKDRLKAAELLGKRYGLFTDKMEVDGIGQVVIVNDLKD